MAIWPCCMETNKRDALAGMSFLQRLMAGRVLLGMLVGGGLLAAPGIAGAWTFDETLGIWRDRPGPAVALPNDAKPRPVPVQAKTKALPTPIVERTPSNVEIVNKALNPGASDPNVPLPRADLPDAAAGEPSSTAGGPQIYGRGEEGGAVLGLRMPIPADRNVSGATTRYSGGEASSASGNEARWR
jgi:hypothetical protein